MYFPLNQGRRACKLHNPPGKTCLIFGLPFAEPGSILWEKIQYNRT